MIKNEVVNIRNLILLISLVFCLVGCQQLNPQQLKTSKLTLVSTDETVKTYSAESLEDAFEALPFKVKLPSHLPEDLTFDTFLLVEDPKHCALHVTAQSEGTTIVIGVSNQILGSKTDSEDQTKNVTLKNNMKAQYTPDGTLQIGTKYLEAATLTWNDQKNEFIIAYSSKENSNDHKEILIQLANEMPK